MKNLFASLLVFMCLHAFAQISLVKDFVPGSGNGSPEHLTVFNNKLYFAAKNGASTGRQLWSVDSTDSVRLEHDFSTFGGDMFSEDYAYEGFAVAGGKLYFNAEGDGHPTYSLWSFDGTTLTNINDTMELPNFLTEMDGKVYMAGANAAYGTELWKYDPATGKLKRRSDINPGSLTAVPKDLTAYNHKLYFSAYNSTTVGTELYVYDPVTDTTSLVSDINPGINGSTPWNLTVYQNKLYFTATTAAYGMELYSYDGTTVTRLTDYVTGPTDGVKGFDASLALYGREVIGYNNAIYFGGDTVGSCHQLARYNIATGTTTLISKILGCQTPQGFVVYKNKLYFTGNDFTHGYELWVYDSAGGMQLVEDLNTGTGSSWPYSITVFNNSLYFAATDGIHGTELFKYHDTTAIHTGVQNLFFKGEVSVYPNPVSSVFNIDVTLKSAEEITIRVVDMNGKEVYQTTNGNCMAGKNTFVVPTTQLLPGTYFYQVLNNTGRLYFNGKVLKE